MIILAVRTDRPESEIYLSDDNKILASDRWLAHRQLAETIHRRMEAALRSAELSWQDVQGIAIYQGPGSFTGLRIGTAVANALASSLSIPIVGSDKADWIEDGIHKLLEGRDEEIILPDYGAEANTTKQVK